MDETVMLSCFKPSTRDGDHFRSKFEAWRNFDMPMIASLFPSVFKCCLNSLSLYTTTLRRRNEIGAPKVTILTSFLFASRGSVYGSHKFHSSDNSISIKYVTEHVVPCGVTHTI